MPNDDSEVVTKGFLRVTLRDAFKESEERLEKRIISEVGSLLSDALQMIANRFDAQDNEIGELKVTVDRIENKLDATIDRAEDHGRRLKWLEKRRRPA